MSECDDKTASAGSSGGEAQVKADSLVTEQCKEQVVESTGGGADPCDPDYAGGDAQERYRELCRRTVECKAFFKKLTECNQRVNSRTKTEEKCIEEVIDYFHCVDHCAAKRFFKLLK